MSKVKAAMALKRECESDWRRLPKSGSAIRKLLDESTAIAFEIVRTSDGELRMRPTAMSEESSMEAGGVVRGSNSSEKAARPIDGKFKSCAFEVAHEIVSDMFELGLVDIKTMRKFDIGCLTPVEATFTPDDLRAIRQRERVSQAVFARHLNVATSTISQWERGERRPEGAALKLIALINAHGLAYVG
jgi:putative transcriptional regulator